MTEIKLSSAVIDYEVEGQGPALVFAHGAGGNRLSWWQQVPAFMDRYTCITFSHPGFGTSSWIGDAADSVEYSEVLLELLDRFEIEKVILVAQSMGGWTCLPIAVYEPQRVDALFMASTPGSLRTPDIDGAREANRSLLDALRKAWVERCDGSFNPALGDRCMREQPALHYLYSAIQDLNSPRTFSPRVGIEPGELAGYSTPTMFVTGEEDVVLPSDVIAAAADVTPGALLQRVPDAGHSVYFERPEIFNSLLSNFLQAVSQKKLQNGV
jgi:3-oxoadipate enol-lactonase